MDLKAVSLLLCLGVVAAQNPIAANPTFDAYGDVFMRGARSPGFWGAIGAPASNVFDEKWNGGGFRQMYNLNSNSPMAGSRGTGFDTTTTMFNQYGPTSFEVIPVQSNFMPQSRLNAYTYDLNEPRMAAIYKNYLRFMNKNIDRLGTVLKGNTDFQDLNDNEARKLKYPSAFQYKNEYFDGRPESESIPAYYHQQLRAEPQPLRLTGERQLRQTNSWRLKSLKRDLRKIEAKLNLLESKPSKRNSGHRIKI